MASDEPIQPEKPTSFNFADFIEQAARETGLDPGQLTRRAEPEAHNEVDLGLLVREQAEQSPEIQDSLSLEAQFEQQCSILEVAGIGRSIEDITGATCPAPTLDQIFDAIEAGGPLVEQKMAQGFTRLVLVPFGRRLHKYILAYNRFVTKQTEDNYLTDLDGQRLDLIPEMRRSGSVIDNETNDDLLYFPNVPLNDSRSAMLYTKAETLEREGTIRGWKVLLMEDLPVLPKAGEAQVIEGRKQIECGLTPNQYLAFLRPVDEQPKPYLGESPITPEDWVAFQLMLTGDGITPGKEGHRRMEYLLGSWLTSLQEFPTAGNIVWHPAFSSASATKSDDDFGVRTAVRIL